MASPAAVLNIIVSASTGQATAALSRVDRQLGRTAASGRAAGTSVSKFDKVAKGVAVGGAAALGYGLLKSIQVGMDFEKQMSSLGAVTGASGKQMDQFKEQALEMGKSTIFGARDVVQAQTELAKGGLRTKDILGGALPAALSLAAAGELDLATAAKTTTNAMNLFNIPARDATKVADMLATAANTTTADVTDFAMALQQGGSAAKQVGFSLNDTVVVLEALAQAGIKNSDAGTSMKTAFLQLMAPTARQAALAKQLGLSFTTQAGEMKKPIQLAGDLQDALGGMTRAQRTAALKVLAGTDGFRTLAALYDLGAKNAAKLSKANEETGTAAETAAKKTDNLAGDLERLKGSLETKGIQIFDDIEPQLRTITQTISDAIDNMPPINWGDFLGDPTTVAARWAGKLGSTIGSGIRNAVKSASRVASRGASLAVNIGGNAVGQARNVVNKVRGLVGKAISFVLSVPTGAISIARSLWGKVKAAISKGISFALSLPGIGGLVARARAIWDAIKNAVSDTISIHIDIPTPSVPHISVPGLARGTDNFKGGAAIVGEEGPELVTLAKGSTVLTARETRQLLGMGVPGFKKGKKPRAKQTGNPLDAALAAAELTASTADDVTAITNLIAYWKRREKHFMKPVRMAGKRGKAMDFDSLTDARRNIKDFTDQLSDLLGGSSDTASADSTLSDLYKELAVTWAQRFNVSQAQFDVLKNGLPPFAGSFGGGGIVPGPIGQPRMAVVHGGEQISSGSGSVVVLIEDGAVDHRRIRKVAGDEAQKLMRRAGRGVGRTPGNAGVLNG